MSAHALQFDGDTHTYRHNGTVVPSVTTILKQFDSSLDAIPDGILQKASERGNAVHYATELHDKGTLDTASVHPVIAPYLEQWVRFLDQQNVQIHAIEQRVFHPLMRYAGTFDRVLTVRAYDGPHILDIKTTAQQSRWHHVQTEGYRSAYSHAGGEVAGRLLIYLSPKGYQLVRCGDQRDRAVWSSAVTLYHYINQ